MKYRIYIIYFRWEPINKILKKTPPIDKTKGNDLTTESRRAIKAVFQEFIDNFSLLYEEQKKWYVPNDELRDRLMDEIYKSLPIYEEFFNKYSKVRFSKQNLFKYLKYPPAAFEDMINELFTESLDI